MDNDPQFRTPDGSALRIWKDTAKNNYLSTSLGRPIFDEAIFVEVISPGSKGSTPVFEVKRTYAPEMGISEPAHGMQYEQFKQYIEDFEKNEAVDASLAGTPLREWPEISRTMAASLRASNIFSVEGLSELPDEKLTVVGPDGRTWRDKARAWLLATKDSGYVTALATELEQAKQDIAARDTQVQELSNEIDKLKAMFAAQAAPPPPPPPPPVQAEPEPAKAAKNVVEDII